MHHKFQITINLRLFYIFIIDIATPEKDITTRRKFKVGMFLLHVLIIVLIISDMMMTKVYSKNYETKSVNRLNYEIYFKHEDMINVVDDPFLITVKIPLPHKVQ